VNIGGLTHRAVCSQSFHGRERSDCVTILGESDGKHDTWYAMLHLLFKVKGESLAFIRWFKVLDPLPNFPMIRLELQPHFDVSPRMEGINPDNLGKVSLLFYI